MLRVVEVENLNVTSFTVDRRDTPRGLMFSGPPSVGRVLRIHLGWLCSEDPPRWVVFWGPT